MHAANELFYRLGYHNVGTEDIAAAVGITAGALYRHFRSKEELLASSLSDAFDRALATLAEHDSADLAAMVSDLVTITVEHRELGVLWTREARHLGEAYLAPLREERFVALAQLTAALREARPDLAAPHAELLAWSVFAVLTSPSYHRVAMAPDALAALLGELALTVYETDLVEVSSPASAATTAGSAAATATATATAAYPGAGSGGPLVEPAGLPRGTRREALLAAAARQFSQRGYQVVTTEDVGAAVGVTSAAVYRHFVTKADLLTAIFARANEALQLGMSRALAASTTPQAGLDNAVAAYVDFAMAHTDLVTVLVAEAVNLPQPYQRRIRQAEHDYVAEWQRLMCSAYPSLDRGVALYRVHAALTLVNELVRNAHPRAHPGLAGHLRLIAGRLLAA